MENKMENFINILKFWKTASKRYSYDSRSLQTFNAVELNSIYGEFFLDFHAIFEYKLNIKIIIE